MAQTFITMIPTNKFAAAILLWGGLVAAQTTSGTFNQQDSKEKGAYGVAGKMIDITNDKSVQTAVTAYDAKKDVESVKGAIQTYKAAKAAQNTSPTGIALTAAKDEMLKYKSSVVGLATWVNNTLKKVQSVLDNVSDRVNRWRTTLPMLRGYAESAGDFVENTTEYISSFEISDLWDLDQTFFRGLEDRVKYGNGLAMSFYYYILQRKDGFGQWSHFFDAFYYDRGVPYTYIYERYGLIQPEIKDLPNEERVGMMAVMEAKVGMERLDMLGKGEYACDEDDPDLECNCPAGSTCKPSTKRELTMKKLMDGFNNPKITTEDMDKLMEQLQNRRLQIASKRKVIQEVKARMAMRYNDVLSYRQAVRGKTQNAACLSSKALLFDKYHLSSPKYLPNTCDDVATFKGTQMNLVAPLSQPVY